jgi:hypothetical protein
MRIAIAVLVGLALVRTDALKVCEDRVAIESVTMGFSVRKDCVRDLFLTLPGELGTTSGALLLIAHG